MLIKTYTLIIIYKKIPDYPKIYLTIPKNIHIYVTVNKTLSKFLKLV